MKKIKKNSVLVFLIQVAIWMMVLIILPLTVWLSTHDAQIAKYMYKMVWNMLKAPLVVYFTNFYIFVPFFFFKKKYWQFVVCNLVMLVCIGYAFFFYGHAMPSQAMVGMIWGMFVYALPMIAVALVVRYYQRNRKIQRMLQEERTKNAEAELAWLKNQINPHFLFNTLNNISSLIQIDPDTAQDVTAQLSDLLRYAMYETNKKLVPIGGEVTFMDNYIRLMKLRCNERTEVKSLFNIKDEKTEVAPLLFISLIENAFKHGVSSSRKSLIDISLCQDDDKIVFTCENTNYPKTTDDRSGSGIGLENTRRRLELVYPDQYEWQQDIVDDMYKVKITIRL